MRAAAWLALALTEEEAFDDSEVVDFARRSSFCLQSNLALLNNSGFVYRATQQVPDLGLILADQISTQLCSLDHMEE